jgi:hypothetical protein
MPFPVVTAAIRSVCCDLAASVSSWGLVMKKIIRRLAPAVCLALLATGLGVTPAAQAGGPDEPVVGDLNGDGRADRVTLRGGAPAACQADLQLGVAGGGYATPVRRTFTVTGAQVSYCPDMGTVVDLGGDGVAELLLTWFWGSPLADADVIVLRDWVRVGGFRGQFQPSSIGSDVDFNGDGLEDLWQTTDQGEGFSSYLNQPSSSVVDGPASVGSDTGVGVEFGDVNGDGGTDVAVTATGVGLNERSDWWLDVIDGKTGYHDPVVPLGAYGLTPDFVDVNADGRVDLVGQWSGDRSLPPTTWLNQGAGRLAQVPLVQESFSAATPRMSKVSGGTWRVTGGRYVLTSPASTSAPGNSNLAVHSTALAGDLTVSAVASVTPTANAFNDFSVVVAYQNPSDYHFVSFNESNDANTSGIFEVSGGVVTQLADITALITAGTAYEIGVEVSGGEIRAYRNRVLVASSQSMYDLPPGKVGFGSRNDAVQFDDLVVRRGVAEPVLEESFTTATGRVAKVSGGTWSVGGGTYRLTSPASTSAPGNSNLAVSQYRDFGGDFTLSARAAVTPTANAFNDFSVVFGYRDPSNYYYASFNETNDASTSGIFRVRNGAVTQLADITNRITAGTSYQIRVERQGTAIRVYRNNALQATATETAALYGRVGFGSRNDSATFDDLVLTPTL